MTYRYTPVGKLARLQSLCAIALATAACNSVDRLTQPSSPSATPLVSTADPSFASAFRGGIPFGTSAQPTSAFGEVLNGALRNIWPAFIREELEAIRSRGGKVVLMFAGNEEHYKDSQGHFDMGKWKARVARFKDVDFSSFISDGTIVGHYLIDEPYDPFNWHGEPVPGSVVEEMAEYSKELWPTMVAIVRAQPDQVRWNGTFRYLDAAWAQYTYQKGDVEDYIRKNVADAQAMGLGLVVGLNLTKGSPKKGELTGEQVESWGSALLSSSYPCAFISWQYQKKHLESSEVGRALESLAAKARNRPSRSCRADGAPPPATNDPEPPPLPEPEQPADSAPEQPSDSTPELPPPDSVDLPTVPDSTPPLPDTASAEPPPAAEAPTILLSATGWADRGVHHMRLTWSGARGTNVDLYRDGMLKRSTPNDGRGLSTRRTQGTGRYSFKVCEAGTSVCSNTVMVSVDAPAIGLSVQLVNKGRKVALRWSGLAGSNADIYENGVLIKRGRNSGSFTHTPRFRRGATYSYRVCQTGTDVCSNSAAVTMK